MTEGTFSTVIPEPKDAASSAVSVPQPVSEKPKDAPEDKPQDQPKTPPFVYPDYPPSQEAVPGVTYDFTCGARILADDTVKDLHLLLMDEESGTVLHDAPLKPGFCVNCAKKYYMKYRILICDENTHRAVFDHVMDMHGRQVLVQMPFEGAVGDSVAWFSVIERFQKQNGAEVHVVMPPHMQALFEKQYPELVFETPDTARKLRPYAAYYLGLYFKGDVDWQPYDFRLLSLTETTARILGLEDLSEIPPRVAFGPRPEGRDRPYVCIATQASSHAKHWCNPRGWRQVIAYLQSCGYDVVCIDRDTEVGCGDVWHTIPHGCVDMTGCRPLQERIDMIHHAAFFIGLSSGLSWIAWMCGVPVVLISGICMPFGEFQTPYRVQCRHSCHGCWNDTRYEFDHHDFMWCPRHKDTPRAFECTKLITAEMVISAVKRIPGVLTPPVGQQEDGQP